MRRKAICALGTMLFCFWGGLSACGGGENFSASDHGDSTTEQAGPEPESDGIDLHGAVLSGVNLEGVNLNSANPKGALLFNAIRPENDIIGWIAGRGGFLKWDGANLRGVDFRAVDLPGVEMLSADLSGAELAGVNFQHADLRGADLIGANLHWASLWEADLGGANLHWANLWQADLGGANLEGAYRPEDDLQAWGWKANEEGVLLPAAR